MTGNAAQNRLQGCNGWPRGGVRRDVRVPPDTSRAQRRASAFLRGRNDPSRVLTETA
jgi:hypothetical protein